jgi:type III pantothenate kinase
MNPFLDWGAEARKSGGMTIRQTPDARRCDTLGSSWSGLSGTGRCVVIVVDAGNTRVKFAWMELASGGGVPRTLGFVAIPVGQPLPIETLQTWIRDGHPGPVVVDGSNPPEVDRVLGEWPAQGARPHTLGSRIHLPLVIEVEYPDKVGIDRLLNAIAANARRQPGQIAIVIDSGTATTVDLVDGTGAFRGGAILPGFEMGAKALHQYTALLPLIPHHRLHDRVPPAVGRNTTEALESGLYWGHVGAVKQLIESICGEHPTPPDVPAPLVMLSGGAAPVLRPHLGDVQWEPALCLQGLALATSAMPGCG